jgi:hypothetical protein
MVAAGQIENRQAKFAFVALADGSAQQVRDEVMAVADTENRDTRRQYFAFKGGARIVVDAMGASGDYQAPGMRQVL